MGCVSAKDTLTIDQIVSTPLVVTVEAGDVVDCTTEVMISASGGVAPYMVVVNDMDTTTFAASTTLMLGGGIQMIDVYDSHMCLMSYQEDLDYVYSMDTTLYAYPGESAEIVYAPAMVDTMLPEGSYSFYYEMSAGCIAELNIEVMESEGPQMVDATPRGRIGDNHPIFKVIFEDSVAMGDMGYLTVTPVDGTDPILTIEITPDMFVGDTLIVDYDWTVVGKLDKNTQYFVEVDSGVVVGAADGFPWDGIQGDNWKFTTGPKFTTGIDTELSAASFVAYPNPFNDKIYIDNFDKLTRVIITNIAGQRVMDVKYPEREIRTANLVSGVYLVSMFTESGLAKTDRIVKR
jgi:hypothetical protein